MLKIARKQRSCMDTSREFYMFVSPWIMGFLLFTMIPMLYSIYASFTTWDGMSSPVWTGIANYAKMFTRDRKFIQSLKCTFYYACCTVPLNMMLSIILAVLLNMRLPGTTFFRSVYYLPCVISGVAVYLVWMYLLRNTGYINVLLDIFGITGPNWLNDRAWSMPGLIIMNTSTCGSQILILLAGLQDIPTAYYEAAMIDGAGEVQQFFKITVPLLTRVIFFNLITGVIGALQMFGQAFTMTEGGPANSTYVYALYIYDKAFKYFDLGYACALAVVLFGITLLLGLFILGTSRSWVHSEEA